MENILNSSLVGAIVGGVFAFITGIVLNKVEDVNKEKVKVSILLYDLKSIENYLAYERGSVNLRYFEDWQKVIANCTCLNSEDIKFLYEIYDRVYNYNYHYKLKEQSGESVCKEDVIYYHDLQKKFFDISKGYVDFNKYSEKYERISNMLEDYIVKKKTLGTKDNEKKTTLILSIIPIVISSITMLTTIYSNFQVADTLRETVISRNLQYKPELKITPTAFGMTWDENGEVLSETENVYQEVDKFTHEISVDEYPAIKVKNIGVGVAKDIVMTWDDEYNFKVINEELERCRSNTSVYLEEELIVIKEKNKQRLIVPQTTQEKVFIPADSSDYSFINLPVTYYDLIKKIVMEGIDYHWSIGLKATCTYNDLQDNEYVANVDMILSPNFCYSYGKDDLPDGKDGCVINIETNMRLKE